MRKPGHDPAKCIHWSHLAIHQCLSQRWIAFPHQWMQVVQPMHHQFETGRSSFELGRALFYDRRFPVQAFPFASCRGVAFVVHGCILTLRHAWKRIDAFTRRWKVFHGQVSHVRAQQARKEIFCSRVVPFHRQQQHSCYVVKALNVSRAWMCTSHAAKKHSFQAFLRCRHFAFFQERAKGSLGIHSDGPFVGLAQRIGRIFRHVDVRQQLLPRRFASGSVETMPLSLFLEFGDVRHRRLVQCSTFRRGTLEVSRRGSNECKHGRR
mmetsp:Transcript_2092/g.13558  ORF Transcript_2092/g.13558 Transcript_2092/m.13558 type:complete len:265 (+) Transcript_2092:5003-5797(+)